MKIKSKMILSFAIVSLIPLLITNFVFYHNEKQNLTNQILNHLESVASIQHNRLRSITKQNRERFRLVASRTQLRISLAKFNAEKKALHREKMNKILKDALTSIKDFKSIYIISIDGSIAASTNVKNLGAGFSKSKFFIHGKKKSCVNSFMMDENNKIILCLFGPLFINKIFIGVLVIESGISNIESSISDYTGLGETGETTLATQNDDGNIVYIISTRFNNNAAFNESILKDKLNLPVMKSLKDKIFKLTNNEDYRGVPVLAVTRYIKDTNWGIVVKIDKSEAFRSINDMRYMLIIMITGSAIIILVVSVALSRGLSMPVIELTDVAKNITEGNFNLRANETTGDETGLLGKAFNKMTDNLLKTQIELEENNKELLSAVEEYEAINEELISTQNELMDSEKRYRILAENVTDVIWTTDMDLNFTYISPSVQRVYGYSVEDAMNRPHEKWHTPESYKRVMGVYEKEIRLEKKGNVDPEKSMNLEFEHLKWDGTIFPVELTVSFIRNGNGKATGIIGVTRDITERKKSEEFIIQHEKMVTVGGLASGMAHEINNPLGIILQGIQVAKNRISSDVEKNRKAALKAGTNIESILSYLKERKVIYYLDGIRDAGMRASKIVANMLKFSRRSESKKMYFNLNLIIINAIEIVSKDYDFKRKYDFRSIKICTDLDRNLPPVKCSEIEIEQVIINLLKNSAYAITNVHYDDYKPEIVICTKIYESKVLIIITDNGTGINSDNIPHIFEPFYTTKDIGVGTGLGLSVSFFIITNNHNGKIYVESEIGKFTRFTIELPLHN